MNIETKWLDDFLSLARTKSFSRSAEERHMTQPAFSRRFRALETALGVQLVDRTGVPVQLTAEGQLFQLTASNLIAQLNDSIRYLRSLKTDDSIIDVALSHTLSLSLFPTFIQSIHNDLKGIKIRQLVANVDDSVQALKNGICDCLVAFDDPTLNSQLFRKIELQTEYLVPVCRNDEEGRSLYDLDVEYITEIPYLAYPDAIFFGRCIERLLRCSAKNIRLEKTFESSMADSLKVMAMRGLGVAWVPTFAIQEELKNGLLTICGGADWRIPLNICLFRYNRPLSPIFERLWSILDRRFVPDISRTAK